VSIRGVARNEMLVQDYDPTRPELEIERAVGRAAAGVTYAARWGSVHFGIAADTREFKGQHAPNAFGSLTVSLHF
jgi:hypothetical protein